VLDIEHLSTINDSFGRHAGDLLLQQVSDRLKRHTDSTERLAHFGAGTFAVIMEGGRRRGRGGALDAGAGHRSVPRAIQRGRPRHPRWT
jgi:diguanylate cyclase (GGDEF)-like protein